MRPGRRLGLSRSRLAAIITTGFTVLLAIAFLWPFLATSAQHLMTIPVGLATVQNAYGALYAQQMALAVLGALPLLVMFLLFQRQIVRGIASAGLKG